VSARRLAALAWGSATLLLCGGAVTPPTYAAAALEPEVVVLAGFDQTRAWLESEDWWGAVHHEEQLSAPNALITGISERWQRTAASLTVPEKKEVFYRLLLPLILHANDLVLKRRAVAEAAAQRLAAGGSLTPEEIETIRASFPILRIQAADASEVTARGPATDAVLEEMLYKLDIVPAGLALGQAAYESGYGTSRFAVQGNALFGQWTFGGEGLAPEQQRAHLGNYGIARFDWPFDSVRAYFINLMSHPAYEPFRRLRAERRAAGEPLSSLALADGLVSYSERGQAYVDSLKGIIRVNKLAVADRAVLRDEPRRFLVGAEDDADVARIREEIDGLRRSGELAQIIDRMNLD
jgi:uncharacterized FlgJ-related protein